MAKAQNQTMTMLCRAFLSIMCAFIAKTTPKNLSHAINVRDKILATSELTEKERNKGDSKLITTDVTIYIE